MRRTGAAMMASGGRAAHWRNLVAAPTKLPTYYWSCTSSRTDLALAARQLAQDIAQVVRHLLTLLRRKCLCELLDRAAPKHLDLLHQPGELVLILRLFGIGHMPYMATDGACSNRVIVSIFRAETLPPISIDRREGARCKVAVAS